MINCQVTLRKIVLTIMLIVASVIIPGCNETTQKSHNDTTIDLPEGMTFVEAGRYKYNLWYIYRARRENEKPETYIMQESSNLGYKKKTIFIEH